MCGLPLRTEPTRIHDVIQRRHSILRNCPILGHVRFMLEAIRPELQQYFIERNFDGRPFDREEFRQKAAHESIKCVSLKLSQGAKPGIGGVLPGAKVTQEIADARSVPKGQTRVSPPGHKVFSTPR
ncbi:MAG TPA: glutamate synthase-related protein, partial [Solirubrobacteraceae bacterium]